jgi:hypothetical protein
LLGAALGFAALPISNMLSLTYLDVWFRAAVAHVVRIKRIDLYLIGAFWGR